VNIITKTTTIKKGEGFVLLLALSLQPFSGCVLVCVVCNLNRTTALLVRI